LRAFLQRVKKASVSVDNKVVGEIDKGLIVYCAFCEKDDKSTLEWVANKIVNLRIFKDLNDKMNLSVLEEEGALLVISNFSLYGNTTHGRRPDFSFSAPREISEPLYDMFLGILKKMIKTQSGIFAADMQVNSLNDGPINIMVEKHPKNYFPTQNEENILSTILSFTSEPVMEAIQE